MRRGVWPNAPGVCTSSGMRIVLTGGPGAGKTAVLETARREFCRHVAVLPESASILFAGGFPRRRTEPAQRAVQRAIFHVQSELERMHAEERPDATLLCDRGTIDGVAYWPGAPESYYAELETSPEAQYARYDLVIHLRVPTTEEGYNNFNPTRIETAAEARAIDERIARAWAGHPRRVFVNSAVDFLEKVRATVALIREAVPGCDCVSARTGAGT